MEASSLIDNLGGTSAVARLCMVKPPSVAEWRHSGIPRARLMYLQALALTRADVAQALQTAGYQLVQDREAA